MPYKNLEDRKAYDKRRYLKNKEYYSKRSKKYREDNQDKISTYNHEYWIQNEKKLKEYAKKYNLQHKEDIRANNKKYYEQNKQTIAQQRKTRDIFRREQRRLKYKQNKQYAIVCRLRTRLTKAIERKSATTKKLVGCDWEFLINYLESNGILTTLNHCQVSI
jgi:hypothetical protein